MRVLLIFFTVVGFCVSAGLGDGPTLQTVQSGKLALPTKIAKLAPDGSVTESREYYGGRGECDYVLVFDCFEPGDDGPTGFDTCGQEDGSNCESGDFRWYSEQCNPYVTNDMEFDPACGGLYVNRLMLAWYWHANGPGTGENCRILIEHFEDFDDTCETGDPNGQGAWLGAVRMDFGYMEGDPGHYWYTDVDLCGLDWLPLPGDGAGSYSIWLLTYDDDDPNTSYLATCAEPTLWGTGDGESPIADCIGRGKGDFCPAHGVPPDGETSHQGPIQWDDDYPTDGWHDAPVECYDYTYGGCPDPLGAMYCCYADCGEPPCPGDIDGDGSTGHSDMGELLSAWCSQPGDPDWNPRADLDCDRHIGHGDLGILLGDWGCGVP
jgi:hypothetical protein